MAANVLLVFSVYVMHLTDISPTFVKIPSSGLLQEAGLLFLFYPFYPPSVSHKNLILLPLAVFFTLFVSRASTYGNGDTLLVWGSTHAEWQMESAGYTVALNWNILAEHGITLFEVERSLDGRTFVTVGEVNADGSPNYQFVDPRADTLHTVYRIKAIHWTGAVSVSQLIDIEGEISSEVEIQVSYQAALQQITVNLAVPSPIDASIDLIGLDGEPVQALQQGRLSKGLHYLYLDTNSLPGGLYFLRVTDELQMHIIPVLYQ